MLSTRTVVVAAVGVLSATSAVASTCSRSYTVVGGDTCFAISQKQKVSSYQLAVLNPDVNDDCTNLAVGQNLCLGVSYADCTAVHTVGSGDVCDSIVANYKINSTLLWANNPQLDAECHNAFIGQGLCVDSKYNVPSLTQGQKPVSTKVPAGAQPIKNVAPAPVSTSVAPASPASSSVPHASSSAVHASSAAAPASSSIAHASSSIAHASSSVAPASSSVAAPVSTSVAPAASTSSVHTHSATPTPSPTKVATSSAAPATTSAATDDDDEDLPWCEDGDDGW